MSVAEYTLQKLAEKNQRTPDCSQGSSAPQKAVKQNPKCSESYNGTHLISVEVQGVWLPPIKGNTSRRHVTTIYKNRL